MNERTPQPGKTRGLFHIIVGLLYIVVATIVIFFRDSVGIVLDNSTAYFVGGLMALYGAFRTWRGYQRVSGQAQGW